MVGCLMKWESLKHFFFFISLSERSLDFLPSLSQVVSSKLMGCLWFWSWKHLLATSSCCFAAVVIAWLFAKADFEVLCPAVASALLYWEALCVFHHVQYLCGGKSGSSSFMLTVVLSALFEAVRLFISVKVPFILAAVSWEKFSSYYNSVNLEQLYQVRRSWLSVYPGVE